MDHLLELVGKQPEAQAPGYFLFHAMGGAGLFSETEKGFRGVISLWRKKTGRGWKSTKNHIGCMYGIFTHI